MSEDQLLMILMWIGGGLYLASKFCLLGKEIARTVESPEWYRPWNIGAWATYFVGLFFIVPFFAHRRMWIGLILAWKGVDAKIPKIYDRIAQTSITLGVA